jgi:hypothetical protein
MFRAILGRETRMARIVEPGRAGFVVVRVIAGSLGPGFGHVLALLPLGRCVHPDLARTAAGRCFVLAGGALDRTRGRPGFPSLDTAVSTGGTLASPGEAGSVPAGSGDAGRLSLCSNAHQ